MKKNWFISLLLAVCCVCFSACGAPHEHNCVEDFVPATCTEEGYNRFVCTCGYFYKGKERTPKVPHTGLVKCTVCEEDYFTIAKDIIVDKGEEVDGVYTYLVDTIVQSGDSNMKYDYTATYDSAAKEIVLIYDYYMNFMNKGEYLPVEKSTMTICDPTVSDAMGNANFAFAWRFWTANKPQEKISIGSGTLNATGFKPATEEVSFEDKVNFDLMPDFEMAAKGFAADSLKTIIFKIFTPLLAKSKSGVTVKDFGFVNF